MSLAASPSTGQATLSLWARIWQLVKPWRRHLLLASVCVLASSLVELVPPLIIRHVIDHDLVLRRTGDLAGSAALYMAAIATAAAFGFGYGYLSAVVAQRAIAALRLQLFEHLARIPIAYFDVTPVGEIISRATSDVETIDELFTGGVANLVGQVVPVVAVVIAMIVLSPTLAAVALLVVPPLVIASRWLQVRVRDAERGTRVAMGRLNTELAETLNGAATISAFGAELRFIHRFRRALLGTLATQARSVRYNAYFQPVTNLLYAVAVAALLWAGTSGLLASAGITIGTLTAFILLFQRFFAPIVAIGDQWQSVQAAVAGAERVFALLDVPPDPPLGEPPTAVPAPHATGIDLRGVTHGYQPGRPVLHDVTMSVRPGEHVALVGRTGAGKSTLVALLGGLVRPWSGSVEVGGRDPSGLADRERRHVLAVVPQSTHLFSDTLRANVTLGDDDITEEQFGAALRLVGLQSVVDELPAGAQTPLSGSGGGAGSQLSAGERQLVALARALAGNPAVVVLDEATAAIDAVSDAAIRRALRHEARDQHRAVLTIAHRLASAREADRVIVLEAGRIVESGAPADLLAAGGRFAALTAIEAAGWDWDDAEHASMDA